MDFLFLIKSKVFWHVCCCFDVWSALIMDQAETLMSGFITKRGHAKCLNLNFFWDSNVKESEEESSEWTTETFSKFIRSKSMFLLRSSDGRERGSNALVLFHFLTLPWFCRIYFTLWYNSEYLYHHRRFTGTGVIYSRTAAEGPSASQFNSCVSCHPEVTASWGPAGF